MFMKCAINYLPLSFAKMAESRKRRECRSDQQFVQSGNTKIVSLPWGLFVFLSCAFEYCDTFIFL